MGNRFGMAAACYGLVCGLMFVLPGSPSAHPGAYSQHEDTALFGGVETLAGEALQAQQIRGQSNADGPLWSIWDDTPTEEVATKLREATRATGRKEYAAANSLYQELLALNPERSLQPYARFLKYTRKIAETSEAAATELRERLLLEAGEEGALNVSPLARARALNEIAGRDAAIDYLDSLGGDIWAQQPEAGLYLNRQLLAARQFDRASVLLTDGLSSTHDDALAERLLFAYLGMMRENSRLLLDKPEKTAAALGRALGATSAPLESLTEPVDPIIIELQLDPEYRKKRQMLLDTLAAEGAGAAWFGARLLIREEEQQEALNYLLNAVKISDPGDPGRSLAVQGLAILYRDTGQLDEYWRTLEELAAVAEGLEADRIQLQVAGAALAVGESVRGYEILSELDTSLLTPHNRRLARVLTIRAAAEIGDVGTILSAYEKVATASPHDDLEFFHKLIFDELDQTEQHWAIEEAGRKRFAADDANTMPRTEPRLWLLIAEAAKQARRGPNQIEAHYQYTLLRPRDVEGLRQLAAAVAPIAEDLAAVEKDQLAVDPAEVEKLVGIAEDSYAELIRRQPYFPEHYIGLMKLYKAKGDEEGARAAPMLMAKDSKDWKMWRTAGYVLATNGYPEDALEAYGKALELDPGNMDILVNRAAAYTRLQRWDDAADFYWELLLKGDDGKAWHVHDIVSRLWLIAKEKGELPDYYKRMREELTNIPLAWRGESARQAAAHAMKEGRLDVAREFARNGFEEGPVRFEGQFNLLADLAKEYMMAGRSDDAITMLKEVEPRYAGDPDFVIRLEIARAELKAAGGDIPGAVAELKQIARADLRSPVALDGYYRAARLLRESGKSEEAQQLLREFLKHIPENDPMRRRAQSELNEMLRDADVKARSAAN